MKKLALMFFVITPLYLISCGGNSDKKAEAEEGTESTPGPVSEMDKSRYNLNSTDEPLYGTTDTLKQDSLAKADSAKRAD